MADVAFDLWIDGERAGPADFMLAIRAGERPEVSLHARTPEDARELRDYLLRRSTFELTYTTLVDALLELESMDHLEAFERCR